MTQATFGKFISTWMNRINRIKIKIGDCSEMADELPLITVIARNEVTKQSRGRGAVTSQKRGARAPLRLAK